MRVGASLSWIPLLLIASTSIVSHVGAKPALAKRHGDDDMPNTHDEMHAAAPVAATADSQPASHPSSSHSHSHAAPLIELDEASLIAEHGPDLPSYWTYDFGGPGDAEPSKGTHRGFMFLHVVAMSLAFFGALPVAIVLRSAKHAWHTYVQGSFLALVMLGGSSGTLYKLATPNFYPGSTHTPIGYIVLAIVTVLSVFDSLPLFRRLWKFAREKPRPSTVKEFWRNVICAAEPAMQLTEHEYTRLMAEVNEQVAEDEMFQNEKGRPSYRHHRHASSTTFIGQWSNDPEHEDPASPATSSSSRRTFVDSPTRTSLDKPSHDDVFPPQPSAEGGSTAKFGRFLFGFSERILLFLAFLQLLNGGTVYAGQCRGSYIHSCAAHFIKGGIFWAYGILTWCRYLGAFSDLGWAWNRRPTSTRSKHFVPSAEMVESLVIFTYGISNTWMERFEAAPGSPFTTKQYQHISIAVMFWFAGLVGVGLESKTLRKWLSATAVTKAIEINDSRSPVEIQEPPSYTGSFNPFPALVIGITGAAMSAHHQTYAFQVGIHALWGYLLSGFAILRFMTYFFMWLRPPKSILPSRPPTEALASFCLAAGGLVFIMSGEEITYALMRRGHDDPMMITNLVAALTSLVFCWFMLILSIKGWAVSQRRRLEAGQL